jgi:hypothetical protein
MLQYGHSVANRLSKNGHECLALAKYAEPAVVAIAVAKFKAPNRRFAGPLGHARTYALGEASDSDLYAGDGRHHCDTCQSVPYRRTRVGFAVGNNDAEVPDEAARYSLWVSIAQFFQ